MKNTTIRQFFLSVCLGLLVLSCATEQNFISWKGGIDPKETYPQEWILRVNAEGQASLSLPYGNAVQITGEAFLRENGSWIFHMDYLEWFSNWHQGWTEARFSMSGSIILTSGEDSWRISIQELPEIGSVLDGQIRYKEDRFYGDRSRDMVSRRWKRVEASVPFIRESLNMEVYHFAHKKEGFYSKEFMRDLESLLFPELYGYKKEFSRPEPGCFVRGEGISWDSCYSRAYLPEALQPVRDSGTLYRDYEEASGFFTLAVTWQDLWEDLIPHSNISLGEE